MTMKTMKLKMKKMKVAYITLATLLPQADFHSKLITGPILTSGEQGDDDRTPPPYRD